MYGEMESAYKFQLENLHGRYHIGEIGVGERITLKLILKE